MHNTTTQHNNTTTQQHNNTTQHNTTQHNTTQHNTTQHNTTQHNTTQHNTTQHNTTTQHNNTTQQRRLPLDVQAGEYPVLPLSIAGAVSMTRAPDSDVLLSGDEWFIFKFDKQQAGLAGLSFDEGRFGEGPPRFIRRRLLALFGSARLALCLPNWLFFTHQPHDHHHQQQPNSQHNTTQHNTTQHNTTQHNATQRTNQQHRPTN